MIKAAQSQTQTLSDVEACINIRDENQNLVWSIYSPLKASSRKPKYSPTLGGLRLNVPGLGTQLSAQEMKIDVLLLLDAEFNTRALSVAKPDSWSPRGEKGAQERLCLYCAFTPKEHCRWGFSFTALPDNLSALCSLP